MDEAEDGDGGGGAFCRLRRRARLRLLRMHYESGVGHIGGNLSCLDTLLVLHHGVLGPADAFILSKGHAAGALYVALWTLGRLTDEDLRAFHGEDTRLSGHPAPGFLPEIPFATGSLGHGLPLAAGMALGKQLRREPGRIYCLTSDGEWQEGSNWEALIFAAHRRVPLTLLVDANGLQGFGTTEEVAGQGALSDQLAAFGVPVADVDGHDPEALRRACAAPPEPLGAPDGGVRVVFARTRKGHGVSFMEDRMEWHYLPLNEAQYRQAAREAGGGDA